MEVATSEEHGGKWTQPRQYQHCLSLLLLLLLLLLVLLEDILGDGDGAITIPQVIALLDAEIGVP